MKSGEKCLLLVLCWESSPPHPTFKEVETRLGKDVVEPKHVVALSYSLAYGDLRDASFEWSILLYLPL